MSADNTEVLRSLKNPAVFDSFIKAKGVLSQHTKILCSISGGSDSDIVIDIIHQLGDKNVTYAWFDTGVEYQATKDHLDELERKYGVKIRREQSSKPIPSCCREYGQPFLSKYVSDMISRLQAHGFQWEDDTFDVLIKKYPNCKTALQWWTDTHFDKNKNVIRSSHFSIKRNRLLKEFILENPPSFPISMKCCNSKKSGLNQFKKVGNFDLEISGVRKAEGGIRADTFKTCFSTGKENGIDRYRPIFWYTNADKEYYCERFGVAHSKCYTEYAMKRTGCAGCPYGRKLFTELETLERYEPKLYKACTNVFADSYYYTKQYREYVERNGNRKYYALLA